MSYLKVKFPAPWNEHGISDFKDEEHSLNNKKSLCEYIIQVNFFSSLINVLNDCGWTALRQKKISNNRMGEEKNKRKKKIRESSVRQKQSLTKSRPSKLWDFFPSSHSLSISKKIGKTKESAKASQITRTHIFSPRGLNKHSANSSALDTLSFIPSQAERETHRSKNQRDTWIPSPHGHF